VKLLVMRATGKARSAVVTDCGSAGQKFGCWFRNKALLRNVAIHLSEPAWRMLGALINVALGRGVLPRLREGWRKRAHLARNNQDRAAAHCMSMMAAFGPHRESGAASWIENGRGGEAG
jgi:hypothetical protein